MATKNSSLVLKILILLAKLKKPLLRKLVSLKKMKKLKLLEHYSYAKEYEFSPSTTPIIEFRRISKYGRLSLRKLYSNLVLICRSVMGSSSRNKEIYQLEMGLSSSLVCAGEMSTELSLSEDDDNDNDDSVDERAEIFIQRFYQEMRRQRIQSNSQLLLPN
ncbi:hypothetical protein SASPL_142778 [Salvia splendens]|uniref:Cotton fiber protein n=1 Tax=Salvia splendens TaxID=180675 RepID=A0A8X8WKD1_SALSN|nr:uncharacterized protein LOC121771174 [Salvia splendens]KAG6396623.1 hypothetical protein SASPL_142778 [Salvia splendens]